MGPSHIKLKFGSNRTNYEHAKILEIARHRSLGYVFWIAAAIPLCTLESRKYCTTYQMYVPLICVGTTVPVCQYGILEIDKIQLAANTIGDNNCSVYSVQ